jgi:hypothetical protein
MAASDFLQLTAIIFPRFQSDKLDSEMELMTENFRLQALVNKLEDEVAALKRK